LTLIDSWFYMVRNLDICVISDVHLGTYGSHADELLHYLQSIHPKVLIINGDFIDAWHFRKKYFPRAHLEVIHHVIQMAINGVRVYYITGNHDDVMRKFSDIAIGPIHLKDSLTIQMYGKKYWFFHGDVFDASILISPTLAMIGGKGYDYLLRFNRSINRLRARFGYQKISLSKRVKNQVKRAVKYVSDFEKQAIKLAIRNSCDYVICGHIHRPVIQEIRQKESVLTYLNSGDWVESLSALEMIDGHWKLFQYEQSPLAGVKLTRRGEEDPESWKNALSKVLASRNIIRLW
jgi:UDP-2,3-diacylglucosamine pyrophosphatase LpxH